MMAGIPTWKSIVASPIKGGQQDQNEWWIPIGQTVN